METNSLVLNVKSDSVEKAAGALNSMAKSATQAENSSNKLASSSSSLSAQNNQVAVSSERRAAATQRAAGAGRLLIGAVVGLTVATAAGVAIYKAYTASQTASTGATATQAGATATATVATAAHTAATARDSVANVGATASTRVYSGAIGLLGATAKIAVPIIAALASAKIAQARAARAATMANRGLMATLAPLLALFGGFAAFSKVLNTTVDLQNYQAQLKTATGSIEGASIAFEALEDFASKTPYALEQSLEAFTKLTNLGLTPSERALTSYGNTASAMGKDLTQLIEAVADATTGEFVRLKEFGIKTKDAGDSVIFTFRGVKTEVGKDAAEIEKYLMALGENEFGGAMAERMNTVGGQLSNLGDLWNELFRTISERGVGNLIGEGIQVGIDMLSNMIDMIKSGQFEAALESWTIGFETWSTDFQNGISYLSEYFAAETGEMGGQGNQIWETWLEGLKNLPSTFAYWMKHLGVEIAAIVDYGTAAGEGLKLAIVAAFESLLDSAKNYGSAIGSALNPFDSQDFTQAFAAGAKRQAEIAKRTATKINAVYDGLESRIDAVRQARLETIGQLKTELGATAKNVDDLGILSDELRKKYEDEKAAKDAARNGKDRLGQFKIIPVGAGTATGNTISTPKGSIATGGNSRASMGGYQSSFSTLPEISNPFGARNEYDYLREQENEITASYERRKQAILELTGITEEEKLALITESQARYQNIMAEADRERNRVSLSLASDFFGDISTMAAAFGEKGAKVAKAAAITQTIIKTYESATSAYASLAGIPYVGPALGAAAAGAAIAAGFANVQAIRSQPIDAGRYATGGIVPGQSPSGDNMQARVNSGEMILNKSQQTKLFNIANGEGSTGGTTVNVVVRPTPGQTADVRQNPNDPNQLEIVLRKVDEKLTNDLQTGSGKFVPALTKRIGDLKKPT